jgi:hypothetical protein
MTVVSVSVLLGVAGSLVAVFQALSEYRLKAQAQRAEIDINLSRLFAELVPIANGRQGTVVSEAGMTAVFSSPEIMQRMLAAVNERERDVIRRVRHPRAAGRGGNASGGRSVGWLSRRGVPAASGASAVSFEGTRVSHGSRRPSEERSRWGYGSHCAR